MKKYFILITAIATMCSINAMATNFDDDPPQKCHFKDSEGHNHNGRMATVSGTWSNNSSNSSSSSRNGSGGVNVGFAEVNGGNNSSSERSSSSSSSNTITRDACCDANNNCESVNYESGWSTRTRK